MTEKSGIDMLEEILTRLSVIENKMELLDKNVKRLLNLSNLDKVADKINGTKFENYAKKAKSPQMSAPVIDNNVSKPAPKKTGKMGIIKTKSDGLTMVFGKMVATVFGKKTTLTNVSVKVFDEEDKMVKETKTNMSGEWRCGLPPGRYIALFEGEYKGKKLIPQNKHFVIKPGAEQLEVN